MPRGKNLDAFKQNEEHNQKLIGKWLSKNKPSTRFEDEGTKMPHLERKMWIPDKVSGAKI